MVRPKKKGLTDSPRKFVHDSVENDVENVSFHDFVNHHIGSRFVKACSQLKRDIQISMASSLLRYTEFLKAPNKPQEWQYLSMIVAATKYDKANKSPHTYEVLEGGSQTSPKFVQPKPSHIDQQTLPTPLGLFVAQPSELKPLSYGPDPNSGAEARYARNFGFVPLSTKKRRGTNQDRLSLYAKVDRKKYPSLFDKHHHIDAGYKPLASDQFLNPEFVKFKNEIERETDRTHVRGMKMSKDTNYSPTTVYERPGLRKQNRFVSPYRKNPVTQADESYKKPMYQDPGNYDDGPSSYITGTSLYSSSAYPGSATYSSSPTYPGSSTYSSSLGPTSSSSYPPYNSYNSYSPPYSSSYTSRSSEPSSQDSDSFPPYPPLPGADSTSSRYPHSENEARGQGFGTFKDFKSYKRGYKDFKDDDLPISDDKSSYKDVNDEENDYPSHHSDIFQKSKQYFPAGKYRKPVIDNEGEDEDGLPEKPPFRGGPRKGSRIGRPYGKPSHITVPVSRTENEDEDFDTNYEPPENPFAGEENADDEEEEDAEEESPPEPKERLRQSSHKEHKRLEPAGSRKRCVKKRKEMTSDDFEDDPVTQMACLVCEDLVTGRTYEKCNSESEPEKKTFFSSDDISYREKSPEVSHKYRKRRDVSIMLKGLDLKRVTRKADKSDGSYTPDPEDFESDSFDEEEQEDDDMAEFRPQPPSYANEDSCVEVKKKNAVCMVCENPGSNGKYEQCSYANEPGQDGYEYAQSSQFGSSRHVEQPSKTSKKQKSKERLRRKVEKKPVELKNTSIVVNGTIPETKANASDIREVQNKTAPLPELMSDIWQDLRDVEQQKIASVNKMFHALVRTKKEQPNSRFLTDLEDSSYEKQFLNLFPQLDTRSTDGPRKSLLSELGKTSIFEKSEMPSFKSKKKLGGSLLGGKSILDSGEEGEMSKMMQEFQSKDRSACQKRMKDKMTCYICDDEDGVKREECMYVVEKEPKKVKYQESKHTRGNPEGRTSKREVNQTPISVGDFSSPLTYRSHHKGATSAEKNPDTYSNVEIHTKKTYSTEGKPTTTVFKRLTTFGDAKDLSKEEDDSQTSSSNKQGAIIRKKKNAKNDEKVSEEEITFDPEETGEFKEEDIQLEVDPGSSNGAFSDETEVTYDKDLRTSLPKFMVEKNEHESVIDDFMSRI